MYKNQKPLTVSSALLASLVTVLVLLAANTAKAQSETEELPLRESLDAPRSVVPANVRADRLNNDLEVRRGTSTPERTRVNQASSSPDRFIDIQAKREEWQKKQTERSEQISRKRAALASSTLERKAALREQAQERISQRVEKLVSFMTRAIERLRGFSQKLQEKSDSLSDRGIDTGETNTLLDAVEEALANTEEALEGIDTNIEYALTSDQPRDDWQDARDQILAAREQLRGAHSLLREAMNELKKAASQQVDEDEDNET